MITKLRTTTNPFGQEWLENLRQVLPTIEGLNISENRLLIDANRKALFITGHKTTYSKAYIGVTKIYLDDNVLKIKTTTLTPHLFIGIIFPFLAIIFFWFSSISTISSAIATIIFMINPTYCIRDISKQDKFNEEVKKEIERMKI